ncbi:MAG: NAD(P)H-dependent flavin oxidoreductase [Candidatus Dormibacteria bacterium]
MKTPFTELVGCRLPLQLAVLGGAGTTELASAVAAAGGLAMVPGGVRPPTDPAPGASGIGFLMPFQPPPDVVARAASRARVVEFFYGEPRAELASIVHAGGALCAWQVGSAEEAEAAASAGCDFIVAQGIEAGGHVRGTAPVRDLLRAVLDTVHVPVVAAGGIATADDVAEVLALGSGAVRIGTRFVACEESVAHPDYVAALVAASGAADTVLTTHFSEGWPNAPHRVLKAAAAKAERTGNRSFTSPHRFEEGDVSDRAMYAGEGVGAVSGIVRAVDVVHELMAPAL